MKLLLNYIDESIPLENDKVTSLEILHTKYLWRFLQDLTKLNNNTELETIRIIDNQLNDVNITNKILIIMDFFNIEINNKKNITLLAKYITNKIPEATITSYNNLYQKLYLKMKTLLNEFDLPITIENEFDIENLLKIFKISFQEKETLIEKLLLLIDIEKIMNIHSIIVLVNIKQFLNIDELKELEKYSIYNKIPLLLVDANSYGKATEYEYKLIIDSDLSEIVI